MKPDATPGRLIIFEGGEGAGKSTQLQHLHRWLQQHPTLQRLQKTGRVPRLELTREPGGTQLGCHLRQLLLDPQGAMVPTTELLLYAADRAQHVETLIRPALAQGCWVLCDRYCDSTLAYQGYGRELNLDLIQQLNRIATGGLWGDLTLWLRVDAAVGLARTRGRGLADRLELADLEFHQRVQAGFAAIAQQHPERVAVIDANAPEAAVAAAIQEVVEERLRQWY